MSSDTWQRWPNGYPTHCMREGCRVEIPAEAPRYKKGKVILCETDGQVEVAGQYKSPARKPDPPPKEQPEGPAKAPAEPSGPDALPALPGVTGLGRIKIGIQWGLPGYSSVVVHVEDSAREGENLEELADRLSITVWQRLVKEGSKVAAATKEPERFLVEPVGEVGPT